MTLSTDEKKKKERTGWDGADAARDSFSETDREIAGQNPEYGERLAKIKQNYNNAQTDEERAGWHNEAEKLSRAYGYSRNADGTVLTPLGGGEAHTGEQAAKSNLATIKAFDDKYALKDDKNGYQAAINSLLGDIMGAKFAYSPEDDPRYMLAQEYARDAMNNQMAESAALSGGYGNSYAAFAGQQVYDDYMEQAANNLEDRAYARFQDEQADRYNRLGILRDLDDTLYSRSLNEREWDYMTDRDALSDARYDDETAYDRLRDALSDTRYDREYTDSRADTAWNQRMTERQYADSRADELYSRALAQSAPKLDLSEALSMYGYGVQSSEVMRTLQDYLGDDIHQSNIKKAIDNLTQEDNVPVTYDDAKDYLAENDVDDRFVSLMMTPEEFTMILNEKGGVFPVKFAGSNTTKKFRDYADYVAAFAEFYSKQNYTNWEDELEL